MDNAAQALECGEIATIIAKASIAPEQGASMIHKLVDFLKEKCGPKTVNKLLDKQCAGGQVFCGCSGSGLNPKVFCFVLRMHVALLCVCINLI